jgi:hypothetical protein
MVKKSSRKAIKRAALDLLELEPDQLREQLRGMLSQLSPEGLASAREAALEVIGNSGLHLGACLLMVGIPAKVPEELTPSDLAQLIRYVRINRPDIFQDVAACLGRVLSTAPARSSLRLAA